MSLWKTVKLELLTPRLFIYSAIASLFYIALFAFVPNYRLLTYSFTAYPAPESFKLFLSLLLGLTQSLSTQDQIFLLLTSVLVGLNIALLLKTFGRLRNQKVRISVGGGTIFALVATGCTSCGLSIISLFGLSAATFSFLPFMGLEFKLISIALLLFSFIYTVRKLDFVCEVKTN